MSQSTAGHNPHFGRRADDLPPAPSSGTQSPDGKLQVVPDQCQFAADRSSGVVVIEATDRQNLSGAIEVLRSAAARNLAISYAASQGVASPGISGTPGPYPVDEKGDDIHAAGSQQSPAAFRVSVPVARKVI